MADPHPWLDLTSSPMALVRDSFYPQHVPGYPFHNFQNGPLRTQLSPSDVAGEGPPPSSAAADADTDPRQTAINTVAAWVFKDPFPKGSVPHFVTATAGLVEAVVHDERNGIYRRAKARANENENADGSGEREAGGNGDGEGFISDGAMRAIYAMSFNRFVTGFVDRDVARRRELGADAARHSSGATKGKGRRPADRNDGAASPSDSASDSSSSSSEIDDEIDEIDTEAPPRPSRARQVTDKARAKAARKSMYVLATHLRLPRSFVDVRHRATHGTLKLQPSLGRWRALAREALGWLWEERWRGLVGGDAGREGRRRGLEGWEALEGRRRRRSQRGVEGSGGGGGGVAAAAADAAVGHGLADKEPRETAERHHVGVVEECAYPDLDGPTGRGGKRKMLSSSSAPPREESVVKRVKTSDGMVPEEETET